jgi:hypothetical protein
MPKETKVTNYAPYGTPGRMRVLVLGSLILGPLVIVGAFFAGKNGGVNIPALVIGIVDTAGVLAMLPSLRKRGKV